MLLLFSGRPAPPGLSLNGHLRILPPLSYEDKREQDRGDRVPRISRLTLIRSRWKNTSNERGNERFAATHRRCTLDSSRVGVPLLVYRALSNEDFKTAAKGDFSRSSHYTVINPSLGFVKGRSWKGTGSNERFIIISITQRR